MMRSIRTSSVVIVLLATAGWAEQHASQYEPSEHSSVFADFRELQTTNSTNTTTTITTCPLSGTNNCHNVTGAPVACTAGEHSNCPYRNQCEANAAGFNGTGSQCSFVAYLNPRFTFLNPGLFAPSLTTAVASTCPQVAEGFRCASDLYDPVRCAANRTSCTYINDCYARGAGWNTSSAQCHAKPDPLFCPPSNDPLVSCLVDAPFRPVACGTAGCVYRDGCFALAAGYNVDRSCISINLGPDPNSNNTSSNNETLLNLDGTNCPAPNAPGITCIYDPQNPPTPAEQVTCGNCTYRTTCLAVAANLVLERDCSSLPIDGLCPNVAGPCTLEYFPVACGINQCVYSNTCLAALSGFNVTLECAPASPPPDCPVANFDDGGACIELYDPVLCGECEYSNACYAGRAGYAEGECVVIGVMNVTDPNDGDCPYREGNCTVEAQPLLCGTTRCFYDNACRATLNGFNVADECTLLNNEPAPNCPLFTGNCTEEYQPLTCGPNDCFYDNACQATSAAFTVDEQCTLLPLQPTNNSTATPPNLDGNNCPLPDDNIIRCILPTVVPPVEEQVRCGNCTYITQCFAFSAGLDLERDCGIINDVETGRPAGGR